MGISNEQYNFQAGEILLIDKPLEWTSFDVVNKIRYTILRKMGIKKIKVGHAGTLDPLATGLLIICTGKFTKRIEEFQAQEKEYTGTFHIGATTPSYDMETEIDSKYDVDHIDETLLKNTAKKFIGEISQVPPIFSAVKIKGERAYNIARKNQDIKLESKIIVIKEFELTKISLPEVSFRVKCSKGTYIRALARDFGESLNSGAYLSSLRRTKIGDLDVDSAYQIDELIKKINHSTVNTANNN
jgi:tRNA pseudouridine55 synthase